VDIIPQVVDVVLEFGFRLSKANLHSLVEFVDVFLEFGFRGIYLLVEFVDVFLELGFRGIYLLVEFVDVFLEFGFRAIYLLVEFVDVFLEFGFRGTCLPVEFVYFFPELAPCNRRVVVGRLIRRLSFSGFCRVCCCRRFRSLRRFLRFLPGLLLPSFSQPPPLPPPNRGLPFSGVRRSGVSFHVVHSFDSPAEYGDNNRHKD